MEASNGEKSSKLTIVFSGLMLSKLINERVKLLIAKNSPAVANQLMIIVKKIATSRFLKDIINIFKRN